MPWRRKRFPRVALQLLLPLSRYNRTEHQMALWSAQLAALSGNIADWQKKYFCQVYRCKIGQLDSKMLMEKWVSFIAFNLCLWSGSRTYPVRHSNVNFAQWRYSNQWSNREVLLLLVENYTQYPGLTGWNTLVWANFWRLLRKQIQQQHLLEREY